MSSDKNLEEKMNLLEQKIAWFQGEDFRLSEAKERFVEAKELAGEIEHMLTDMKNEIDVLAKDFSKD